MKSAVLFAGASLLLAGFEGVMASSNPEVLAAVPEEIDGDGSLPLNNLHHHHGHHGHHHHHHCSQSSCQAKASQGCVTVTQRPCTVIKSCSGGNSQCTVTDTCTVQIPDPTTIYKNRICTVTAQADPVTVTKMRVCTTTVEAFKTVTKCFNHVQTKTEYFPKYTTTTATVTMVDPGQASTSTTTATVTVVDHPSYSYSSSTPTVTVVDPGTKCTPRPSRPCCLATQRQHVVGLGDDVFDIAAIYNTTVDSLFQDNSFLATDSELKVGDVLCVSPSQSNEQVEKRDSAHHHHHSSSCGDSSEQSCDPPKKKHHKHKHHKHHHHHKATKTTDQTCIVTPEVDTDSCGDSAIHCGLCRAWHNVWPGDTTSNIAQRYQVSDGEVRHLNPWIGNGDKLNEGDWVCVAGCDIPIRFESASSSSSSSMSSFDSSEECAPEHICVPCARPAVCPQGGMHAACPENYSCMKKL